MKARNDEMSGAHPPMRFCLVLCAIAVLAATQHSAIAQEAEDVRGVILVYGANLPDWRDYVVELLREDPRFDETTIIPINTSDCLSVALLFPNVKAAILLGQNADVVRRVEAQVLTCFNHGGGLVGFHDFTSVEVTPGVASQVFPLFANVSRLGRVKEGVFVQSLVRETVHEINADLPPEMDIRDPEINIALSTRLNKWSGRVPTAGELTILYRDTTYGAPVVASYTDGGASVSFAGGDIDNSPDIKLKYFGNLFFDEVFQGLLLNSVEWVADKGTRTEEQLPEAMAELRKANDREQDVRDLARKARAQREAGVLAFKLGINVVGICAIFLIYVKLIRRKPE